MNLKNLSARILVGLYFGTFMMAACEKVTAGGVPNWFYDQFSKTPLGFFPALIGLSFVGIAVLEGILAVLFGLVLISRRDPFRSRFFAAALIGTLFLFVSLSLGQRLSGKYPDSGFLTMQALLTFLILRKVSDER